MAYPDKYTRGYGFASFQESHPQSPLPGSQVDVEFDAAAKSTAAITAFLQKFARSDGRLANGSVGVDQLAPDLTIGFKAPTTWEPSVLYSLGATVFYLSGFYNCVTAHTSGSSFNPDFWDLILDFGSSASAAAASAAAAAASETAAGASATNAGDSEEAASASESAAAASATAAATSATNAGDSEEAASASESAAAASATDAAASAAIVAGALRYTVATLAEAKALFAADVEVPDGAVLTIACRETRGDFYFGNFVYDASDTTTDFTRDGAGTVDDVGRRWFRDLEGGCIDPGYFGAAADAETDDSAAFIAALAYAATVGLPVKCRGRTYKVDATLTVDIATVLFDLEGGTLDFSDLDASPAIKVTTSLTDPNQMTAAHRAHPICNGTILGPSSENGIVCFQSVSVTAAETPWICGITYHSISIHGFAVMHDIDDGDFFLNMTNCNMGALNGRSCGWLLRSVGATNSGENMQITNCIVTNAEGFYLEEAGNSNMDINVSNASIDGVTYIATGGDLATPGTDGFTAQIKMFGGHWEALTYTDYAIWCSASFIAYGVDQLLTGTLANAPFKCDATGLAVGIVLRDHTFISDGTAEFPGGHVCDGSGRFVLEQKALGNTFVFSGAVANNRVPSYTFPNSDSLTTNWTGAQYDSSDKPTGAVASCKLDGSHTTAIFFTPCLPGQSVAAQAKVKISNPDTGDTINLTLVYKDVGTNTLLVGGTTTVSDSPSAYTNAQVIATAVAPPGTVSAGLVIGYSQFAGPATVRFGLPEMQIV